MFLMLVFTVQKVNTKVIKKGLKVRYQQRYLELWEHHPQLAGSIGFLLAC